MTDPLEVQSNKQAVAEAQTIIDGLNDRLSRKTREIQIIQSISSEISSTLDIDRIHEIVLGSMDEVFGFHHSMVLLADESGGELRVTASRGFAQTGVGASVRVGTGVIGMVAKKRRMMRLGNLRTQRRYAGVVRESVVAAGGAVGDQVPMPGLPDVGSQIAIPLMVKDRLVGVFAVESPEDNAFDALDEVILKIVANQVASAIDHANAYTHQARLTEAYSRFVPREFLAHLNRESIVSVQLGDQLQGTMTVLFADIRSFTTLSESMSPAENFAFLNAYLRMVAPVIRSCHGFIDKYIGDAIMAIFPDSPADAMQAAAGMHRSLERYNDSRALKGRKPIRIGVGVHTGSLMLGVIGVEDRMEGTVISDSVNLASRIEGLTGPYGARVLVSAQALEGGLRDGVRARFVDRVRVKGKNEPVELHELLDPATPDGARKLETLASFEIAVEHYQQRRFGEAFAGFDRILALDNADGAARIYAARARQWSEQGVPDDWSPVVKLDSK